MTTTTAATTGPAPGGPVAVLAAVDWLARQRWLAYALLASSAYLSVASLLARGRVNHSAETTVLMEATFALAGMVGLAWRRVQLGLPPAVDWRVAVGVSGGVLALAVSGPVRNSHDLWSYAMYGRIIAVHHASPYTHVPADFPRDPFLRLVDPRWRRTGSVYGPVFVAYAALVSKVAGSSMLVTRYAFKGIAGLSVFASLLVLRRHRVDPTALCCLGLNPLVIEYAVGGGHNDPMVGLGILVGVLLCRSRRAGWAGVVLGLAALVKIVAVLAVVALVVWLWYRHEDGDRHLLSRLVVACGAVIAAGYAFAGGFSAFGPLDKASQGADWASFWRPVSHDLRTTGLAPHTGLFAIVLVLAVAGLLLYRHRYDHGPEVLVMSALLAYQLCSAYVLIWYLLWVLPVAMLRWRTLTAQALMAYGTVLLFATAFEPDPRERFDRVLFAHGNTLHVFAVISIVALVVTAVISRPRSSPHHGPPVATALGPTSDTVARHLSRGESAAVTKPGRG